jgi:predicted ATP-grasp superfamily ATP-dependent carboligase
VPLTILVTGAGTGLGNNVIRSLRAADSSVTVLGCHDNRFDLKKSAADRQYLLPSPDARGFARRLLRLLDGEGVDLVVPASDRDVRALSRHRRRLGRRAFLPGPGAIALGQDKYALNRRLGGRGVPVPRTFAVTSLASVDAIVRRLPARRGMWCRVRRGSGAFAAAPVRTATQARAWIAYWASMRGVPVRDFTLSEYLPGRDFACQTLWERGRLVLAKTFERVSYYGGGARAGGASSVAALAVAAVAPQVVEVSAAAVRALDPGMSGLCCLDLKENAAAMPCVTEINVGRFSLSTGLYDLIGKHNMIGVYIRLALGESVDLGEPYDTAPDHYLIRDVDTLPAVVHADELFEGITDLR